MTFPWGFAGPSHPPDCPRSCCRGRGWIAQHFLREPRGSSAAFLGKCRPVQGPRVGPLARDRVSLGVGEPRSVSDAMPGFSSWSVQREICVASGRRRAGVRLVGRLSQCEGHR